MTTVDVLIVSFNTRDLLASCLESIDAHRPPSDVGVSVSVFDNASSDGSPEMVRERFPHVRLVHSQENLGFAAANNRLARASTADYVMLLNSDTRFTEDIITPLLAAIRSAPDAVLAGPRLVYPDGRPQFSSERFPSLGFELARELKGTKAGLLLRSRIERTLDHYRRRNEIEGRVSHRAEHLWATCWLIRREEILRYGLFDEEFITYDEDLDFCRRLRERGAGAVYLASTELVHVGGASSTTDAKATLVKVAREKYYRRHAGPIQARAFRLLAATVGSMKALHPKRTWHRGVQRIKEWKVWQLDGELRYKPVVDVLPTLELPICEVGSGPRGLAAWTPREVIGVDPGPDARHGELITARNFHRVQGDGANIPLADRSAAAAVAVDTFEHIPRDARPAVVAEMKRVVAEGGRVILIGPTGAAAARGDAKVLSRWRALDEHSGVVEWLSEHQLFGLPTVQELVGYLGADRVAGVTVTGAFNIRLWWIMHRALLGDFSRSRPLFALQLLFTHPFAWLARRWRWGPFYRYLVVAEISR